MSFLLNDNEIESLLQEPKPVDAGLVASMRPRAKRGHKEWDLDVQGASVGQFRVVVRQSDANPLDFSAILIYLRPRTNQQFRLRRYNGRSHMHSNKLENQQFYDFHIHMATERYQEMGMREDAYAERSDRYADLDGALRCLQ